MDKLYTCEEVAIRYGVKTFTIWEWIRTNKARTFISENTVPHYMARQGNKMYRYKEVWEAIAETRWQSA